MATDISALERMSSNATGRYPCAATNTCEPGTCVPSRTCLTHDTCTFTIRP
ncbi:hypothetical protein SAMN05444920_1011151 [Nonomuraea solani]|uniref:Uncharacterized protein n=1 Tax=Nonomuraea solani TaxID=1144553 RepID=A0A1H5WDG7_9ACTN|nr:hypothetical protein [Nonomuraea solani]SEF97502.1 hypothetical protein SAMN05444920_1011151 [Nonomuraea solani]